MLDRQNLYSCLIQQLVALSPKDRLVLGLHYTKQHNIHFTNNKKVNIDKHTSLY